MVLCGVTLAGFSTTVFFDVVTRTLGHPWLWRQEVTMTFFVYGVFIGAAAATRRNDHLCLSAITEAMTGERGVGRHIQSARHPRRGALHGLFRLPRLPRRFRQFPQAVDDPARFALCGDPAFGHADRSVHGRAARQWLAQRLRRPRRQIRRRELWQLPVRSANALPISGPTWDLTSWPVLSQPSA